MSKVCAITGKKRVIKKYLLARAHLKKTAVLALRKSACIAER